MARVKYEVAGELGLLERMRSQEKSSLSFKEYGKIGGQMVRRMIREAKSKLAR
ncbi:MAG TPA: small, acid-soluble spore protein, alpha/beta type [Firmicutes bacterium]|nr:small, acid-soluble spore protein, alpha/beta type [Bacillota bacterium]